RSAGARRTFGPAVRNPLGVRGSPDWDVGSSLQRNYESNDQGLGGLWRDAAKTWLADEALDAVQLRLVDSGHVAVGNLECLTRDHLVYDRPSRQSVMRVDPR